MAEPAVAFEGVSKRFRLGTGHDSLCDLLAAGWRRLRGRRRPDADRKASASTLWALRDVSFGAAPGEALGIIGPNGAGKSTALRLLAGILRPDEGEVRVRGRVSALIEVGAGFHGDLTGRENIFLNGTILGMSRREVRSKLDDIVGFAGLERFLDTPVKRYSSGMYARLGFSIAAHVDPDVLLVDEVLSVGDAVFRLRCFERMQALVQGGTALVFVTHNLEQMQAICPQAVVLNSGQVAFAGEARAAVGHYLEAMSHAYRVRPTDLPAGKDGRPTDVELLGVTLRDTTGGQLVWTTAGSEMTAEVQLRLRRPIARAVVELNLRATPRDNLLSFNSGRAGRYFDLPAGTHTVALHVGQLPLASGQYFWSVRVWDADRGTTELNSDRSFPLVVDDQGRGTGILAVDHAWDAQPDARPAQPTAEEAAEHGAPATCSS